MVVLCVGFIMFTVINCKSINGSTMLRRQQPQGDITSHNATCVKIGIYCDCDWYINVGSYLLSLPNGLSLGRNNSIPLHCLFIQNSDSFVPRL